MQNKKTGKLRRAALTGMVCSGILFCAGGGYLYARPWTAVTNQLQTDIVDISMVEYQQKDTANGTIRTLWKDGTVILPGDRISLIPQINNLGSDCYVRARVTCSGSLKDTDLLPFGMKDDWFLAPDGYFYYKKVLSEKSSTELFAGVVVSDTVDPREAGKEGYLTVCVDAIQSRNFTPEFQNDDPWGNVAILSCKKDANTRIRLLKASDKKDFQIVWQGDMEKLVANANDFFADFPELLPGDTITDQVTVSNASDSPVTIYFRSDAMENEDSLLEKIRLKIELEKQGTTQLIYDGNLGADPLKEEISLGTVSAQENAVFVYTISVPEELDNPWALSEESVVWYFSTEPVQNKTTSIPRKGISRSVQTKDALPKTCMALAGISFTVCMILLPYRERRQKNDETT